MSAPLRERHPKAAPRNRAAKISLARKAAFDVLMAVDRGHSHSDDLLRREAVDALPAADRNLTTALVLGVLRWQIRLDDLLRKLLDKPQGKLDREVLIALRIGAFQILHMDRVPTHAAIDESVELAKRAGHRFASGMVNAVLRKLTALSVASLPDETAAQLALAASHPEWLVERWVQFYGIDAARAICHHGQSQPVMALRVPGAEIDSELAQANVLLDAGRLVRAARIVRSGDVLATSAFREGRVRMQDEGSQLVAEIAAVCAGECPASILDACAAPGGKTMILAERNPHARIVACESSAARCEQMRKRLEPWGERIECRLADAAQLSEEGTFDLVLADVPCSGTGTLGRNPEIRHRLRLEELQRHAERQRAILSAALRAVRPGGRVVYSTCSLEPEENDEVVAIVLETMPNVRQVMLRESIEELSRRSLIAADADGQLFEALTPQGAIRLFPDTFNTDGFFIALLERSA